MRNIALGFLVCGLLAVNGFAAATITNGSFEAVQIGPPYVTANPSAIPGWTHSGSPGDGLLWAIGYADGGGTVYVTGDGNQFVTMGGGCCDGPGSASWTTTITGLSAGTVYQVGFKSTAETNYLSQTGTVTVGAASMNFTPPNDFSPNYWGGWTQYYIDFTATGPTATLTFSVNNITQDMGLDAVTISQVNSVPEPGTWSLMLAAGGALAAVRRKLLFR